MLAYELSSAFFRGHDYQRWLALDWILDLQIAHRVVVSASVQSGAAWRCDNLQRTSAHILIQI